MRMKNKMGRVLHSAESVRRPDGVEGILIAFIAVLLILTGCAAPRGIEMDYGTSYNLAIFSQTLNPEAAENLNPVIGFYGQAAEATMERYQKGFEGEKPGPPVYSINVGNIRQ